MKNPAFECGSFYHVYNRGADKRATFLDADDYQRFIRGLYFYNDEHPPLHPRLRSSEVQPLQSGPAQQIVRVVALCLMSNHFHLLLQQVQEGGITRFMRKIGTGYTMYFNTRYERSGVLFQGRYKAKHVADQSYLRQLVHYIHANPVGDCAEVQPLQMVDRLDSHPWSSWHAYCGGHEFRDTVHKEILLELLGSADYREDFTNWVRDRELVPHLAEVQPLKETSEGLLV